MQVSKNGDRFFLIDSGGAQDGDILRMLGVGAMRKFSRATSMPASNKRRIMRGELLAGPMVQTILNDEKSYSLVKKSLHLPRLNRQKMHWPRVRLSCGREFRDDAREEVDAFVERRKRNTLVICMHATSILVGHRERGKAVSLYVVQPELSGVRCSSG